ncbi:MAG: rhodanese [Desulfobulbaceae bacterium BRH_c16a]|nr:MAG: rhodanese [Desulfobulbaceae bacterium BRH_c16a]
MKQANTPIRQAFRQVPLLIVMACLIALAVNHWRGTPIPLIGDWSVSGRFTDGDGKDLTISLEEAQHLFDRNAARFLDARPQPQYESGHISSALSLPWQDANNAFTDIAEKLEDKDTLITYCDGESCELSHDLAVFLKDMGFTDVRVLVNGWTVWQDAGLPTQKGGAADDQQ